MVKAGLCLIQGLQYAFLEAAYKGNIDKVKYFIGQGCPVSTTDQVRAALEGQPNIIDLLVNQYNGSLNDVDNVSGV